MKICRFIYADQVFYGRLADDSEILPLEGKFFEYESLQQVVKVSEVKILPPVTPSKIVCVGRNYADHARELGNDVPTEPLLFLKAPSAIITNNDQIVLPPQSSQIEHEGELAVVIGRKCKNLSASNNALDYVLGYICLNDVTARDLQRRDVQFTRAKSFDTFCPISHFIETELDISDLRIKTFVNGELRQDGRTSQMIFSVDFLIRYISHCMTLSPFDIIATGTPAGVGPLKDGDICEVTIEGIGTLKNPVKSYEKNTEKGS